MKTSALESLYIIDGQKKDLSPARMLNECLLDCQVTETTSQQWDTIIDETPDPSPAPDVYDPAKVDSYAKQIEDYLAKGRPVSLVFPSSASYGILSKALLDAIWKDGHFTLEDLCIRADWKWDFSPVGNTAAFYNSVEAVYDFLDSMDKKISRYTISEGDSRQLEINAELLSSSEDSIDAEDDIFAGITPFHKEIEMSGTRAVPEAILPCETDWLIYVPFDTCDFRLGGSALSQSQGLTGHAAIHAPDTYYFIDCYEVIREMVEDKVAVSGATICDGGLMTALKKMSANGCGAHINLSGIMKAYSETDIVRILFSETPGVIIQIKDLDYDYIDAEMLLQDVAWFPLGHPTPSDKDIRITSGEMGISGILQSLLGSQISEGED